MIFHLDVLSYSLIVKFNVDCNFPLNVLIIIIIIINRFV